MEEKIHDLIIKSRQADPEATMTLIQMFMPLIQSLSRKKGWHIESEDIQSILILKLIETLKAMPSLPTDGQNVKYIATTLKNHFLNIIRKLNHLEEKEQFNLENIDERGKYDEENIVFDDIISCLNTKKQIILKLKYKEMLSDIEIAKRLGLSRQAINKSLKSAYKDILQKYFF